MRPAASRSGASAPASGSPAASAATARSWWSAPTRAKCSRSTRRRHAALERAGVERSAGRAASSREGRGAGAQRRQPHLRASAAEDGKRRWVYQRPRRSLTCASPVGLTRHPRRRSTPDSPAASWSRSSLANGAAALGGDGGAAQGRDRAGARRRRRRRCRRSQGGKSARPPTRAASPASTSQNGNLLWARDMSSARPASAFDARYVFVSDDKGAVHALDRASGAQRLEAGQARVPRSCPLPLPLGTEVGGRRPPGLRAFPRARIRRLRRRASRPTAAAIARRAGQAARAASWCRPQRRAVRADPE